MKTDVLIVGGGDGGLAAYRTIRRLRPDLEITIVKPERGFCFKCPLPFYIAGEAPKGGVLHGDEEMFKGVNLVYGRVEDFSKAGREAILSDGQKIRFSSMILATGSKPKLPQIPGVNLRNVFTLRSFEDAEGILEALREGGDAAIVGGGYIATELAEALRKRGVNVTLIVRSRLFRTSFDEDMAALIRQSLESNGVKVVQGQPSQLEGRGKIESIRLEGGGKVKASLTVFATGVEPVLEPAIRLGAAVGSRGVIVDETMETTVKGVYAVGEIAQVKHAVSGRPVSAQTAAVAMVQGFVAGFNLAGFAAQYPGDLQCLLSKVFTLHIGRAGLTSWEAQEAGFAAVSKTVQYRDQYTSLPGGRNFTAKMVFDRVSGRLLGCQFLGEANVADKVDAAALALRYGATVHQLAFHGSASFPALTFNPRFNQFREPAMQLLTEMLAVEGRKG